MPKALDETIGAVLLGFTITVFLYGVTCVQSFIYYQRYKADRPWLRYMILALWVIDSVHAALSVELVYWLLVTNFDNLPALEAYRWPNATQIILANVNDFCVRAFFSRRIWFLSNKNKPLLLFLAVVNVAVTILGIAYGATTAPFHSFAQLANILWFVYTALGTSIFADSVIAFLLCYYLYNSKTGVRRTDSVLSTLMLYSVNTGLITVVFQILTLIAATVWSKTLINVCFFMPLSKLYLNALLTSLNARDTLRAETMKTNVSFAPGSTNSFAMSNTAGGNTTVPTKPPGMDSTMGSLSGPGMAVGLKSRLSDVQTEA